jgi:hypothetical protein
MLCDIAMELVQIFLTCAPGEFEDLLTLRLYLKPKFNCPNCFIPREGFTRDDLPDQFRDDTAIRIRLARTRPLSTVPPKEDRVIEVS